jgi:hypothetical protein
MISRSKWIRRIWRLVNKKPNEIEDEVKTHPKGWVYALFNSVTKRIYIGETSRTPLDRLQEHIRAAKGKDEKRKSYNYMRRILIGNWTMIPIVHADTKEELERLEEIWKYKFRNNIINDPVIWTLKPTRKNVKGKPKEKPKRLSQKERVEKRKQMTTELRAKVSMVLYDKEERWRTWSIRTMLDLLTHINVAKVPKKHAKSVFHRIKPLIFNLTGINIKREYTFTLMHCNSKSFKKQIKKRICEIIEIRL